MNLARVEAQALIGRLITAAPELEVAEVRYGDDTVVRGPQYLGVRLFKRHPRQRDRGIQSSHGNKCSL